VALVIVADGDGGDLEDAGQVGGARGKPAESGNAGQRPAVRPPLRRTARDTNPAELGITGLSSRAPAPAGRGKTSHSGTSLSIDLAAMADSQNEVALGRPGVDHPVVADAEAEQAGKLT